MRQNAARTEHPNTEIAAPPRPGAAVRIAAAPAELWEREARLKLDEGDMAAALATLDRALLAMPGSVQLLLCRSTARAMAGDLPGAAQDAAEAVIGSIGDLAAVAAPAKAALGRHLLDLGRLADARACLAEAVAALPGALAARLALALALERLGEPRRAATVLAEGVALLPGACALRTAAVLLEVRQGAFAAAVRIAEQARSEGVADACVLGLLGHARSSQGQHATAATAYAEALTLAPGDPYVRHLVAAAGMAPDLGRAPADYVRVVFDGYAARFDAHLMCLGYRVPGLARAELDGVARGGAALDLGCGTGLMAVALSDLPLGPVVGVDLSPRMLAAAAARRLYAELHEADLEGFLAAETRRFPLILAGDVLPYFGDLGALFRHIASCLAPGGRFLFSAETLPGAPPPGWRLGRLGRYRHGPAHIAAAAAAAGLAPLTLRSEVIRFEADQPVPGLLGVFEGAAA